MRLLILFLTFLVISCLGKTSKQENNLDSEIQSTDSVNNEENRPIKLDSVETEEVRTDSLKHVWHKEDQDYPWYDTPVVGEWIEEKHINELINIFANDTTLSILSKMKSRNICNNEMPRYIQIEGCDKDKIFYLINRYCNSSYLAKSQEYVYTKDTIMLMNYYNNYRYELVFPNQRELLVNGIKFIRTNHFNKLNNVLDGSYRLYDSNNNLIDSVRYNGRMVFHNDSIFTMTLVEYIKNTDGSLETVTIPIITNADIMKLYLFTGKKDLKSGEPEIKDFYYEIKRTKTGFELHNRRSFWGIEDSDLIRGLHFKFEKIE